MGSASTATKVVIDVDPLRSLPVRAQYRISDLARGGCFAQDQYEAERTRARVFGTQMPRWAWLEERNYLVRIGPGRWRFADAVVDFLGVKDGVRDSSS